MGNGLNIINEILLKANANQFKVNVVMIHIERHIHILVKHLT